MQHPILPKETLDELTESLKVAGETFRIVDGGIIVPKWKESFSVPENCRYGIPATWYASRLLTQSSISQGKPFMWKVRELVALNRGTPRYLSIKGVGVYRELYHVDIWHAYYQFYRHLHWRGEIGDYQNKTTQYYVGGSFDWLKDWKQARNAVVGLAVSRYEKWYKGYEPFKIRKKLNPWLSPYLWSALMDMMHFLAWTAVYIFQAVYVDNDGYIFLDAHSRDGFTGYLTDSNIAFREQSGLGIIYGLKDFELSDYRVGEGKMASRGIWGIDDDCDSDAFVYITNQLKLDQLKHKPDPVPARVSKTGRSRT
jgi:hypothetical protein